MESPRRAATLAIAATLAALVILATLLRDRDRPEPAGPVEVPVRALGPGEEARVERAGIGAVLTAHADGLGVAQVIAGGGAAEAGLRGGDVVLEVNGRPVLELGTTAAIDAIRGPEGTLVVLRVRRGGAVIEVQVPRRAVRG